MESACWVSMPGSGPATISKWMGARSAAPAAFLMATLFSTRARSWWTWIHRLWFLHLRVPKAKLAKRELDSAEQRVVTLRELLGDDTPGLGEIQSALSKAFSGRFGLEITHGELTDEERLQADILYREEIGTEEFVGEIEEPPAARGDLTGRHSQPRWNHHDISSPGRAGAESRARRFDHR